MTRWFLDLLFNGDRRGEYRHFSTSCIFTLILYTWGLGLLLSGNIVFLLGLILELTPSNTFSKIDLLYNFLGISFAFLIIHVKVFF